MMARVVGNSAAEPTPAMNWPKYICTTPVDVVEISSPTSRISAPPTSSFFRPNRSPSTPKVSSRAAIGSRIASEIQSSWDAPVGCSTVWKVPFSVAGTATPIWARHTAKPTATTVARLSVVWRERGPALVTACPGDPNGVDIQLPSNMYELVGNTFGAVSRAHKQGLPFSGMALKFASTDGPAELRARTTSDAGVRIIRWDGAD